MTKQVLNWSLSFAIAIGSAMTSMSAYGADWGSLKGRVLVDGTAPAQKPLDAAKDAFCNEQKPKSQNIVVGKDNGLANAVIWLRLGPGQKVEINPEFAADLKKPAVLDNKACEFRPHVCLVRVGQELIIKNSDPTGHNTKASLVANGQFNVTIAAGQETKAPITKAESLPLPVNCNIHPFMEGHLFVQDHPYMAVTDADGNFEIKNIPAGKHEFVFWHESPGYLKDIALKGGKTNNRGRAELTVPAGGTLDVGDVKVKASVLK